MPKLVVSSSDPAGDPFARSDSSISKEEQGASMASSSRMIPPGNLGEFIFNGEFVPSSLVEITPVLRVASEVEATNPRVAYLCRYYAWEMAHRLDPTSSGRGVRRFKAALLQRLEGEKDPSLTGRVQQSDAREIQTFYRNYYKNYILGLGKAMDSKDKAKRVQMTKEYHTAVVLYDVLNAVKLNQKLEADQKIPETQHDQQVEDNKKVYLPSSRLIRAKRSIYKIVCAACSSACRCRGPPGRSAASSSFTST